MPLRDNHSHLVSREALATLLSVTMLIAAAMSQAEDYSKAVLWYRSPLPLGAEGFELASAHRIFFVLGSAENEELDGLKITRAFKGGLVETRDGQQLQNYPATLNFRVTATALDPTMLTTDIARIDEPTDLNAMLLGLHFRLKVFRALNLEIMQPIAVQLIGVPADLPYDERIYRVSFNTGDIPVDARMALEVLSPQGELLTRFHFELL
ncbi:MAG TPA: hypothetical protein VN622_07315 [Clostridia bacterium]|nr:hypothetical protein [Clostridia bacterium]